MRKVQAAHLSQALDQYVAETLVLQCSRDICFGIEPIKPAPQRQRIMQSEAFNIPDPQPRSLN